MKKSVLATDIVIVAFLYVISVIFMFVASNYEDKGNEILANSFYTGAFIAGIIVMIYFLRDLKLFVKGSKFWWIVAFIFLYIFTVPVYLIKLLKYYSGSFGKNHFQSG